VNPDVLTQPGRADPVKFVIDKNLNHRHLKDVNAAWWRPIWVVVGRQNILQMRDCNR
jgi:hypothetical protein